MIELPEHVEAIDTDVIVDLRLNIVRFKLQVNGVWSDYITNIPGTLTAHLAHSIEAYLHARPSTPYPPCDPADTGKAAEVQPSDEQQSSGETPPGNRAGGE